LLSNDPEVTEVRALVRRPLQPDTAGLSVRECKTDFEHLQNHPDWFEVDWVFCALGTTMRQARSREAFRRVDCEYSRVIAKTASCWSAPMVRTHAPASFTFGSKASSKTRRDRSAIGH
jgi:hypothetical protein